MTIQPLPSRPRSVRIVWPTRRLARVSGRAHAPLTGTVDEAPAVEIDAERSVEGTVRGSRLLADGA